MSGGTANYYQYFRTKCSAQILHLSLNRTLPYLSRCLRFKKANNGDWKGSFKLTHMPVYLLICNARDRIMYFPILVPRGRVNELTSVFLCVCPLIAYQLRHNLVKVLFSNLFIRARAIGHFRITFSLFLKASLGAYPFI